jgi:hypothetical protein
MLKKIHKIKVDEMSHFRELMNCPVDELSTLRDLMNCPILGA